MGLKMYKKAFGFLCIFGFAVLITACTGHSANNSEVFNKIHIGIVQTTQNSNLSYISFYDSSLNFLSEKKIKYGDMGDDTRLPLVTNDSVYVVPLGLGNRKELKIALKFNKETWQYKKLPINQQGTLMFCVEKENLYTTNTFNNQGTITKCNTITKDLETWSMEGVIISSLKCYDGVLYAWGTQSENNVDQPYLFLFDTNPLKLSKKISIEKSGSYQYASFKKGSDIYFTNNYTTYQEREGNILSKYNMKTGIIENILLGGNSPYQIFEYKDKLYITHCDPLFHQGNKITVYDCQTGSQTLVTMENTLVQCELYEDLLYSRDDQSLYVYDMNTLKLIEKKNIEIPRKEANMHFRIVGFFIND
ncbi:hypothetical protein QA584_07670 [Anaerocolumna sp. AGMB13025]|uniref:hypothetical protein n=1 Tax=Anaerocolumna sp. AGMB13025 TaxID=3039116 RepID=UPI0024200E7C|nr:hypothetical protein [Anaerocolumna sp. AGMB13025]WFR58950.1 hypothetical protein QA584_07670 [Anaerocolumna sp. AGMB13025]